MCAGVNHARGGGKRGRRWSWGERCHKEEDKMREKEREENASDRNRAMRGGLRRGGRASGWVGWVCVLPGGGNLSNWFSLTAWTQSCLSTWQTDSVRFSPCIGTIHAYTQINHTHTSTSTRAKSSHQMMCQRSALLFQSGTHLLLCPNYRLSYSLSCALIALVIRLVTFYFISLSFYKHRVK